MLEIVFVPFPGSDVVPAYLDLHVRIPNSRRTIRATDFDLAQSRLRLPSSGFSVDLTNWQIHESSKSLRRGYKRIVLVAPQDVVLPLTAGDRVELTLSHKDAEAVVEGIAAGQRLDEEARGAVAAGQEPARMAPTNPLDLLTAYPILTSNVPPDVGTGTPTSTVTQAKQLISQVLGRSVRDGDQASLFAALDRQFVYSDVDGADVYEPRSGPTPIQSGIGADVSGAQLSLATLAQRTADEIGGYVADAQPLRPVVDNPQEIEAFRSNFQSSWGSFVALVGQEGGFPVVRADLFLLEARRALVYLGQELGMAVPDPDSPPDGFPPKFIPTYIVTPDDARAQAQFQIVCDRIQTVVNAFGTYAEQEAPTPDYGIALVTLERDLDIVTECVGNVRTALASLGISDEEQQQITAETDLGADAEELMLSDLVGWCADLPEEGRGLLQNGVTGAGLLAERADALNNYLGAFYDQLTGREFMTRNGSRPDPRLTMSRVTVPLGLLSGAVSRVAQDAVTFAGEGEPAPRPRKSKR